ncbi:hypothetical protein [Halolamina sp.]|nr:hypothetical protein Halar_2108 [halophilic archaeon DL31]
MQDEATLTETDKESYQPDTATIETVSDNEINLLRYHCHRDFRSVSY